jgi:hypothetical protein
MLWYLEELALPGVAASKQDPVVDLCYSSKPASVFPEIISDVQDLYLILRSWADSLPSSLGAPEPGIFPASTRDASPHLNSAYMLY